jgi:plastocyanin
MKSSPFALIISLTLALAVFLTGCNAAGPAVSQAVATPTAMSQAATTPTTMTQAEPTVAPTSTVMPATTPSPAPTQMPVTPTPMPTQTPSAPTMSGHDHGGEPMQADIQVFQFRPDPLDVPVGTTIVWTNQDDIEHSVTHGTSPTPGDAFDSGLFPKGESFSFTFETAGEYPYFCTRHPSMQGLVSVTP